MNEVARIFIRNELKIHRVKYKEKLYHLYLLILNRYQKHIIKSMAKKWFTFYTRLKSISYYVFVKIQNIFLEEVASYQVL